MPSAENLLSKITDKNNNIKYNRSFFKHKILPFHTREPERAKFKKGFQGVLGSLTRLSLGLNPKFDGEESPISIEELDLDFTPDSLRDEILEELTSNNTVNSINHPYFLNYLPSSDQNDRKGEIDIAGILLELLNLDFNQNWKESVGNKDSSNLFEQILIESLSILEKNDYKKSYIIFNKQNYQYITADLEYLTTKNDFFMKNIHKFFAFYYFQYIIQTSIYLNNFESHNNDFTHLYFTLENERITSTRKSVKRGFNLVASLKNDLLTNETLIGYLNFLINSDHTYSIQEILEFDDDSRNSLNNNLISFMQGYALITEDRNLDTITFNKDLLENIKMLKQWLLKDLTNETKTRFSKSIDEIGNLYFLKSRGPLGKVLSLDTDMIILLSALIVKDKTMILHDVFKGFEERGVWFDQYTKEEIVNLYERMNILDKKSDSGEAKYVKPIL